MSVVMMILVLLCEIYRCELNGLTGFLEEYGSTNMIEGHRGHGAGNTLEKERARQHCNVDDAHPELSILEIPRLLVAMD